MRPQENLEYWHLRKARHSLKDGCSGCLFEAELNIRRFPLWERIWYRITNLFS